jgi:vacuolar-type H+-ATPase subunit E/Vma4
VAEADERAAHPVVDEATLTASLGQHSAQILRHAHDEAARIVVQAQEGASTCCARPRARPTRFRPAARAPRPSGWRRPSSWWPTPTQEAREEVERIRYDALAEADAVIARAKDEGRALLEQVQEARKRVMADLAGRRRALSIQIEQLRAARDEMAASVQGVRGSIDAILTQLEHSDDDARAAGLAAADQARLHLPKDLPEEETVPSVEAGEDPAHGGVTPSVDELFARIRAGTDAAQDQGGATAEAESRRPIAATAAAAVTGHRGRGREESGTGPGPHRPARRAALTHFGAALAAHQAGARRRPEPAARRPAQHTERGRRSPARARGPAPVDVHLGGTGSPGRRLRGRDGLRRGDGGAIGSGPAVEQAAAGLARTVVTMLRRRIEDGTDGGEEVASGWGRPSGSGGASGSNGWSAISPCRPSRPAWRRPPLREGLVRWVLTSPNGCSDCDDNALAGAVAVAEGFPPGMPILRPIRAVGAWWRPDQDGLDPGWAARRRTLGSPRAYPQGPFRLPARPARAGGPGGGRRGHRRPHHPAGLAADAGQTSTPTACGSPRCTTTTSSPPCW